MKAKLKLLGVSSLMIVMILGAYLINSNRKISEYKTDTQRLNFRSIANYIKIDTEEQKEKLKMDMYDPNFKNSSITSKKVETDKKEVEEEKKEVVEEVKEEIVPAIVYDGLTLEQLTEKLNKSLNSTVSNKGSLIASYSLEKGVDPYIATAIMLHETGCQNECSRLVKECNNVGGQKGSGCGSYSYFNSLDEGIKAFIDNIYKNYVSYGLTTPESMNSKYAADKNWSVYVNKYIENIKAR